MNRRDFLKYATAAGITAVAARESVLRIQERDAVQAGGVRAFSAGPGDADSFARFLSPAGGSGTYLRSDGSVPSWAQPTFTDLLPAIGPSTTGDYELTTNQRWIAARGVQSGFYVRGAGDVLRSMMRLSILGGVDNLVEFGDSALDMTLRGTGVRNNDVNWRDFRLQDSSLVTGVGYGKLRRLAGSTLGAIQFASNESPSLWRFLTGWATGDSAFPYLNAEVIDFLSTSVITWVVSDPVPNSGLIQITPVFTLPAHETSHRSGGSDPLSHANLPGVTADQHHAQSHGAADHSGDVIPAANQDFGAFYSDFGQIAAPANPGAGVRRLYMDSGTGKLSVRTSAGSTVSLEEQGGGGGEDMGGALVARRYGTITKTNIGTAYVDIYTTGTAFDEEHHAKVDFTNFDEVRLVWIWDYVGAGTQQVRVVDRDNNANVLVEPAGFTADQDPGDSGWVALPAAFQNAIKNLEWQGKSTTGGDDPVPKGWALFAR